ncbi:MAG: octaprenyl-diphosphate synthase [Francisellaceae bacterium]|nr:octaprenyl-diphosphate synthase [Francisellaceae bacterium]
MLITDIKNLVRDEFKTVDKLIYSYLNSEVILINDIIHHVIQSGGKRLRPLVLLLCAKACGYEGSDHTQLAAIIEFLHTASLLHDDVIDNSNLRRGKNTANVKWGNSHAILVGDYLYSRIFELLVKLENNEIMNIFAKTSNVIAEGEILQLMNHKNIQITEDAYLKIISCKTASLFSAASVMGAVLTQQKNLFIPLKNFGFHLGMSFQLIDDILDYEGSNELLGKPHGHDLNEGKITLPLIYLLKTVGSFEKRKIIDILESSNVNKFKIIQELIFKNNALDHAFHLVNYHTEKALEALDYMPFNKFTEGAISLANYAKHRSF